MRALSEDIDLFAGSYSVDVVVELEEEQRRHRGPAFKLDTTSTENRWGSIMVRDIEQDARTLVKHFIAYFGCGPEVIDRMQIPESLRRMLREAHGRTS